jgi:CBS domain-containing protein
MRVNDLMERDVKSCRLHDSLSAAARQMWENDCGCVPVLDDDSRVVGMVTDRDICMAAHFQKRPLGEIEIPSAMSDEIFACRSDDPIETAERTMREKQIRRLPVTDDRGRILGILSLNDIALEAERERRSSKGNQEVKSEEVAMTLAAVCDPNRRAAGASAG